MAFHRVPVVIGTDTLRGRALVPTLVYVGLLVAVVSSLGSPLVPTIAHDYRVTYGAAQWSLTITLMMGALTSPVVGRFGDGPRRRHVLIAALGVLVAGSALAALPIHVFSLLIVGRGMQGVGLSLLPLVMSIARDHLETARARSTLATLSVTAVVGVGLGYPLTGLIAEHLNFRAGFWLAALLGLIAMGLSLAVVPTSMHREPQPFDVAGAILLSIGLAGVLIAISEGDEWGWGSNRLIVVALVSLCVVAAWIRHELHSHLPLVELRLMRNRTVLTANVTGVMAGVGMYMLLSMIIRYVQTPTSVEYGLGASVVIGGVALVPLSAASFLASKLATFTSRWLAPARLLPLGVLCFSGGLVVFISARSHLWEVFVVMAISGVGIGSSFAVMPRMIVSAIPAGETASALALNQVLRTVGYSIGSALAATILTSHTGKTAEFPANVGYTDAALVALGLCMITALVSALLPGPGRKANSRLDAEQELSVEESTDAAISGVISFEPDDSGGRESTNELADHDNANRS